MLPYRIQLLGELSGIANNNFVRTNAENFIEWRTRVCMIQLNNHSAVHFNTIPANKNIDHIFPPHNQAETVKTLTNERYLSMLQVEL